MEQQYFKYETFSELFETNHLKMIVDGISISFTFFLFLCRFSSVNGRHSQSYSVKTITSCISYIVTIETNVVQRIWKKKPRSLKKSMNPNSDVDLQKFPPV